MHPWEFLWRPTPPAPPRRDNAVVGELHDLSIVTDDLQLRVKILERNAVYSLYMLVVSIILGSIIIGFGLFAFAGTLASLEQVSYYGAAKNIEFGLTQNKIAFEQLLAKITTSNGAELAKDQITAISTEFANLDESLKLLKTSLPDSAKASENANQRLLISSITTRVAAASLLAFLVAVGFAICRIGRGNPNARPSATRPCRR
jgi:hypothetical protein